MGEFKAGLHIRGAVGSFRIVNRCGNALNVRCELPKDRGRNV